jgi:hypothetical protein
MYFVEIIALLWIVFTYICCVKGNIRELTNTGKSVLESYALVCR